MLKRWHHSKSFVDILIDFDWFWHSANSKGITIKKVFRDLLLFIFGNGSYSKLIVLMLHYERQAMVRCEYRFYIFSKFVHSLNHDL